jgi:hypothetical protein
MLLLPPFYFLRAAKTNSSNFLYQFCPRTVLEKMIEKILLTGHHRVGKKTTPSATPKATVLGITLSPCYFANWLTPRACERFVVD